MITISPCAAVGATFPAAFQLVLAANPCPCGNYGARDADCTCPPHARRRYLARLCGPLLDRVDIQLRVRRITAARCGWRRRGAARHQPRHPRGSESAPPERAPRSGSSGTPWRLNAHVPGAWLRSQARGAWRRRATRRARPGARTRRDHDARLRPGAPARVDARRSRRRGPSRARTRSGAPCSCGKAAQRMSTSDRTSAEAQRLASADAARSRVGQTRSSVRPAERFARAAWTAIAEPGDRDRGILIAASARSQALDRLVDGWATPSGLAAEPSSDLRHAELSDDQWTQAAPSKRWEPRAARPPSSCSPCGRPPGSAAVAGARRPDWPAAARRPGSARAVRALGARRPGRLQALDGRSRWSAARAATGYGEHVTIEAASGLVDRGFAIVSGAAYGIDGSAHRAALASQGTTVAVLAGGLDRFYPSGHEQLLGGSSTAGWSSPRCRRARRRRSGGSLLRNRLIAALAGATVVVEAGGGSGSLNTAGHAATLGRPLGAVPGPVTAPRARAAIACSASSRRRA